MDNNKNSMYCRLCNGETSFVFNNKILHKFYVNYYRCSNCESLQTEKPYWLDEAYEKSNLSEDDFGAAYRTLRNQEKVFILSKLLNVRKALDWGAGDGLLCRLLRDYGLNFYSNDKYSVPKYSSMFVLTDYNNLDLIVSFEVFEHMSEPNREIGFLFEKKPNSIFISTLFYKNNEKNWHYLHPNTGMHIFFYSQKSLEMLAIKYGYDIVFFENKYVLFYKKGSISNLKLNIFKILFNRYLTKLVRLYLTCIPARGIEEDKKILTD